MKPKIITVEDGAFRVALSVISTGGKGLSVSLFGGSGPHVGGVVLGVPRAKSNQEGMTCDISQICLAGHKDVVAGAEVAKLLALGSRQPVAVTCGIHVDNADDQAIERLMSNCREAALRWLDRYVSESGVSLSDDAASC